MKYAFVQQAAIYNTWYHYMTQLDRCIACESKVFDAHSQTQ